MNRISTIAALSGLILTGTATHAAETVTFNQMTHEALGQATLEVSPNQSFLRVSNLGANGTDGFRTHTPDSTGFWSAEFITDFMAGETLSVNPISEGVAVAPLELTATATGFSAFVEFTASPHTTYSVTIRDGGEVVATWRCRSDLSCMSESSRGNGGRGSPGGIIIDVQPLPGALEAFCGNLMFRQGGSGNFTHGMRLMASGSISVGGQHLGDGDEIIVTERVKGPRYSYEGFQAVDVQTSAAQIVIIDESAY